MQTSTATTTIAIRAQTPIWNSAILQISGGFIWRPAIISSFLVFVYGSGINCIAYIWMKIIGPRFAFI